MPLFVPLDVTWPDDESIIEVGVEGAGAHAIVLCLAKRMETDGWVSRRLLARYGVTDALVALLSSCAPAPLVEVRDDGAVRSVGWLKRNPSQAAIAAKRAAKVEAGKRGNHRKWDHPGDYEDCPRCNPPDPQVVAGCENAASQGDAEGIADTSPESESEAFACDRSKPVDNFDGQTPGGWMAAKDARAALRPVPDQQNPAGETGAGCVGGGGSSARAIGGAS